MIRSALAFAIIVLASIPPHLSDSLTFGPLYTDPVSDVIGELPDNPGTLLAPSSMTQLLHLPAWLCGIIIVGTFVLLAVGGLPLFRRFTAGRLHLTEEMNDDIIFFASAIAVFYSLTVGLIAVGVWSSYSNVEDIVSAEAATIACI